MSGWRRPVLLGTVALVASLVVSWIASAPPEPPPLLTPLEGPPPEDGVLRFVVLGDQGKGNDSQRAVGQAMGTVCERLGGCAFALTVGDNFYPSGVESVTDPLWEVAFEQPYAHLDFPFWITLGNHDYGGNGAGWEFWKADPQLEYARKNPKWKLPARHYAFSHGPVDVFVLDTTAIFYGITQEQTEALRARLKASNRRWKIVAGHHPYLSNGKHGNAGRYDSVPSPLPASGAPVKAFVEEEVCGKFDLLLTGHDHNLQDLVSPCPTELVVSGAGANTTRLRGDNPVHFQTDVSGFLIVEATSQRLAVRFFDAEARELHARTLRGEAP